MPINTHETVAEVTRRLPHLHRRDVKEVLEVVMEPWLDELARPHGEVRLTGFGRLYVETHMVRVAGVVRAGLVARLGSVAPLTLQRRMIRFSPSKALEWKLKGEPDHG
jgi:nucleoid DNA-binding protein